MIWLRALSRFQTRARPKPITSAKQNTREASMACELARQGAKHHLLQERLMKNLTRGVPIALLRTQEQSCQPRPTRMLVDEAPPLQARPVETPAALICQSDSMWPRRR